MCLEIFVDGACKGNPGVGGWGVHYKSKDIVRNLCGGEENTTNNRMELLAAIRALEFLEHPTKVNIYTDSQYVQKGISEWINGWRKNGWKTSKGTPVKNDDLWKTLDELTRCRGHEISWKWIKGHSDNEGNTNADILANLGVKMILEGK